MRASQRELVSFFKVSRSWPVKGENCLRGCGRLDETKKDKMDEDETLRSKYNIPEKCQEILVKSARY